MPNAILCITGSELTRGETHDLNGPFLATHLSEMGAHVDEVLLVPDDPRLLAAAAVGAMARADVVILSGGLGPTADDHTVHVLAGVFGKPVQRHPEAESRMRARARSRGLTDDKIPANYYKQAEVVGGAEVLLNPVGLAPGMILPTPRGLLAVLPGVPREMQAMFRELVAPAIARRFDLVAPRILRAKVIGIGESWAEARIQALGLDLTRLEYGISAKPGELLVKLIAHRPEDHELLDAARAQLGDAFGSDIFFLPEGLTDAAGSALETEQSRLTHTALLAAGLRVATAESCTGGAVARSLTEHAGSSAYFAGSAVTYANDVKTRVLDVPPALLESHGAVSPQVCEAMACGALVLFDADLAVAVTGIAGPDGGTAEKPVGLVYLGVAAGVRGEPRPPVTIERKSFPGRRENVRQAATVYALELLRRAATTR